MARTAAEALREHGFGDGRRLMRLARKVAVDEMTRRGGAVGSPRFDDLVAFLTEQGCRSALRFDPEKATSTFEAFAGRQMALRVTDFYRRKGEGFADRRFFPQVEILLCTNVAEAIVEPPDPDPTFDTVAESLEATCHEPAFCR